MSQFVMPGREPGTGLPLTMLLLEWIAGTNPAMTTNDPPRV
jgi:hypothetical protein